MTPSVQLFAASARLISPAVVATVCIWAMSVRILRSVSIHFL